MDFGRIPKNQLNKIEFLLPDDPESNQLVLKGKKLIPSIYIGCAKWARKEWLGKFYPKGTKESQFLDEYLKQFNSVELNASHYKMYKPADIQKWTEKINKKDFKFSPKVYKGITHFGSLTNKERLTKNFLQSMSSFGKYLGPIFIQMPDKFSPKRKTELFDFLKTLPANMDFFLELRHSDWFPDPEKEELFKLLKKLKIGFIITDTAGRRDVLQLHLTIPKAFIRFTGNDLHKTDFTRIDQWVERISYWINNGLKELYFFMHMHDEGKSPDLCVYLIEQLNKNCGLCLQPPVKVRT